MLKLDIAVTFGGTLLSTVLSLGFSVIVARMLGPENQGLLGLALLVPTIIDAFCLLGQDIVNATYAGLHKDRRPSLFLQSLLMAAAGGLVSVLAICSFYFWLPINRGEFARLSPTIVAYTCAYAPVSLLAAMLVALVRGVGRISSAAAFTVLLAAAQFILAAVFLWGLGCGLQTAVLLFVFTPILSIVLCVWTLRDYATLRPSAFSVALFRKSLGFGGLVSLATLAGFLVYRLSQGMLAYMVAADQVGLYLVAAGLADRVKLLPAAISSAFLPRLANELAARQSQVPAVFRRVLIVSLISIPLIGLLGVLLIFVLYGPAYTGSIPTLVILLPGVAGLGGASILSSDLLTRGKPRYSVTVGYSMLILNVVLNLLLIPPLGIAGAALAGTTCYLGAGAMWVGFYRRESGASLMELVPRWIDLVYIVTGTWDMAQKGLRRVFSRPVPDNAPALPQNHRFQ